MNYTENNNKFLGMFIDRLVYSSSLIIDYVDTYSRKCDKK